MTSPTAGTPVTTTTGLSPLPGPAKGASTARKKSRLLSKIKAVAAPAHTPVFDIAGMQIVDSDRLVDTKVTGISPVVVDGAVVEVDPEEFGVVTPLRYPVSGKHRSGESCKRDERRKGCCKIPIHRILPSTLTGWRTLLPPCRSHERARAIFAPGKTSDVQIKLRAILFLPGSKLLLRL
jgi:hypothetical protein